MRTRGWGWDATRLRRWNSGDTPQNGRRISKIRIPEGRGRGRGPGPGHGRWGKKGCTSAARLSHLAIDHASVSRCAWGGGYDRTNFCPEEKVITLMLCFLKRKKC